MLALASGALAGLCGTLDRGLAGTVEAELSQDNLGGVNGDLNSGSVGFLAGDLVDVDGPLLTVDLNDFAFATLVITTDNENLIILANREGADLEAFKSTGQRY